MGKITIGFGVALIALGVLGYVAGGASSITGLIPAVFGVILSGLGFWAMRGSAKTAMHIASVVALIGVLAPLSRLVPSLASGSELSLAFWSNALMFALCGALLALYVRSFVLARRARAAA